MLNNALGSSLNNFGSHSKVVLSFNWIHLLVFACIFLCVHSSNPKDGQLVHAHGHTCCADRRVSISFVLEFSMSDSLYLNPYLTIHVAWPHLYIIGLLFDGYWNHLNFLC